MKIEMEVNLFPFVGKCIFLGFFFWLKLIKLNNHKRLLDFINRGVRGTIHEVVFILFGAISNLFIWTKLYKCLDVGEESPKSKLT